MLLLSCNSGCRNLLSCPCVEFSREPSGRNMRYLLASVILRLLGSRVVHEDADLSFYPMQSPQSKREVESLPEASSVPSADFSGESLFDRLLLVLYGLLSSCQPSWLRPKPAFKSSNNTSKDSSGFDREIAESLQVCSSVEYFSKLCIIFAMI